MSEQGTNPTIAPNVQSAEYRAWYWNEYYPVMARIGARIRADLEAGKVIICRFCGEQVRLVGERDVCDCPELRE